MEQELKQLEEQFNRDSQGAKTQEDLEVLRVKYLGRKSSFNELFSRIPSLPKEQRGLWGKNLNILKQKITRALSDKGNQFNSQEKKIDLSFPPVEIDRGSIHILRSVLARICRIFEKLGFAVVEGGEIEDEWHNFEALNIPLEHPSRDVFDTFYLQTPKGTHIHKSKKEKPQGSYLLRSHTSPSQIRVMKENPPPLAVISPGRVYRPDQVDATHSFMFHQIEGFAVSRELNFAHLKGVLLYFAREFFNPGVNLRLRPHFFPFTEPSAEVDISCFICSDTRSQKPEVRRQKSEKNNAIRKCSVCKGKGWLEILGCGMIHPNVLESCAIDSKKYKGFAFGMGVERIAMLKYGIDDIRLFYENDVRFLSQF
ncbi:MAG: phenylalanine--tRNA ligase subunit alpha [Candidatus Omnitrophota bacterium]